MEKKNISIIKTALLFLFAFLFIIPMLTAMLTKSFPLEKILDHNPGPKTYEGTDQSYFAAEKWFGENAKESFEKIAYYFDDVDWIEHLGPIIKTCTNPQEARKVLEEQLHINLDDLPVNFDDLYNYLKEN